MNDGGQVIIDPATPLIHRWMAEDVWTVAVAARVLAVIVMALCVRANRERQERNRQMHQRGMYFSQTNGRPSAG